MYPPRPTPSTLAAALNTLSAGGMLELDLCIDGVDCLRVLAKLCNREQLSAVHKLRVRLTDQSLLVEVLAALPKLRTNKGY